MLWSYRKLVVNFEKQEFIITNVMFDLKASFFFFLKIFTFNISHGKRKYRYINLLIKVNKQR